MIPVAPTSWNTTRLHGFSTDDDDDDDRRRQSGLSPPALATGVLFFFASFVLQSFPVRLSVLYSMILARRTRRSGCWRKQRASAFSFEFLVKRFSEEFAFFFFWDNSRSFCFVSHFVSHREFVSRYRWDKESLFRADFYVDGHCL